MRLVLFDFDGTITRKDSLFEIARFSCPWFIFYCKLFLLLPIFLGVKTRIVQPQKAKEVFLRAYFGGQSEEDFARLCSRFCSEVVPVIVRPSAIVELKKYITAKSEVCIVSASPENWILPWAENYGIRVVATKLEFISGTFEGSILGKNCNGREKVRRIVEAYDLSKFDEIIAYGDSPGDKPMLELAHVTYFKPFRS